MKSMDFRPSKSRLSAKIPLFVGLFVSCIAAFVSAQEPPPIAPALPDGPLLKSAPNYSKWTISYGVPKDSKAAPMSADAPHRAAVSKTQNILHEAVFDGRGCCTDTWYLGVQQYRKPHGGKAWFLSEPAAVNTAQDSSYDPLPASGYRDWEWVGKDAYVGTVEFEGRPSLAFIPGGIKVLGTVDSEKLKELLEAQPHIAYVDAQSRLPVMQKKGTVELRYRFESLPQSLLTLPPELATQIRKNEEARTRLLQPAARPY